MTLKYPVSFIFLHSTNKLRNVGHSLLHLALRLCYFPKRQIYKYSPKNGDGEYFNTNYKFFPYLSNIFTIDYHRYIVSGNIYNYNTSTSITDALYSMLNCFLSVSPYVTENTV